ncbi:hypothetical protein BDA99DRAFT_534127 [Phascolomyces articulosus]|uniref:C3H1-type domain-containing protein n=1 Tax=Phascolomyces articulosus TaxID=60185 RepID=A0AAD5K6D4_9FUNG|nr:hypothetical protein BDA99DRAFT_534127 [Phascolomyces articulosus]
MSTNAELLQRIAQLSGAIRQHQISQSSNNTPSYNSNSNSYRGRGSFRGSPSLRGNSQWTRGGGRGGGSVHRTLNNSTPSFTHHKKLILNQPSPPTTTITPTTSITSNTIINKSTSYPTFNPSMSYTRPSLVRPTPVPVTQSRPTAPSTHEPKRVLINGISFLVKGKKLIREDKLNPRTAPTPAAVATVAAVAAKLPTTGSHVLVSRRLIHGRRDKNGNMSIGQTPRKVVKKVKPQRSKRGNMILVREPEGYVRQGRTGKSLVLKTKRVIRRYCGMFTRYGVCPKGTRCIFLHERNHRAICPKFLLNRCRKSEAECRLSHTPTPNIMPHCVHFQRGKCNNAECIWMHVRVRPDAPVCRSFAMEGYCPKGLECREKHIHVCPEFAETGKCSNANCRLPHVARRTAASTTESENKTASSSSPSVAGIVRPGSWVSAAYFNAQKQAKRKQAEEKKKNKGNMEWNNPALQQQQSSPKKEEKLVAPAVVPRKTREEEEEEGFVRLFDGSDDDEGGWAQYTSRQDDSLEGLRFNEDESDDDDDDDDEAEEEDEDSSDSDSGSDGGSDSEDGYEEFEIADEDGDIIM